MSKGAPEGRAGASGNLRRRILSSLVLGLLVLAAIVLGGIAFRFFAVAMAALIFHEWMAMRPPAAGAHKILAWAALAAVLAGLLAGLPAPLAFAVLAAALVVVFAHAFLSGAGVWSSAGILYAGLPALALVLLRGADEAGLLAVLFLFAVVWATDVAAYFAGRALGGPRLAPAISPGKTWSGALGGAVGGIAAGLTVMHFFAVPLSPLVAGPGALVLSAVSQLGDLFESALKRRHGVKDSGALIPGHGGVMDRVDGLVAAAVLLYVLGALNSGAAAPAVGFFSR